MNKQEANHNKIISVFIISLLVIFAAILRVPTFFLPHNHGDQLFFLGLAMKLDTIGLKEYNLRGIDVVSDREVLAVVNSRHGQKGSLLDAFEEDNVFYYSQEKLSNMPPAFSFLIMLSHRMFNPKGLYTSVNMNLGPYAVIFRPKTYFNVQFYAVWLNFMFSILLILTTFFLAKLLFNENVGLWAALLIAISPVDILTSQRLWTDEMAAYFTTLSIFLYWLGRERKKLIFFWASGISAGIAALTKQSGAFVIIILILYDLLMRWKRDKKITVGLLFHKELICFVVYALAVCGFWYAKITLVYGVPWYMCPQEGIEKVASWFIFLAKKPRYGQLYYFVYLLPLFGFFYYEVLKTIIKRTFSPERIFCIMWVVLFLIFLICIPAKEERYMLPAYPAIGMFSGIVIENIRKRFNIKTVRFLGDLIVISLLFFTGIWSIGLGLSGVFKNSAYLLGF